MLKTEQEKVPEIQIWIQREDPERLTKIDGMVCRIWNPSDFPGTVYEQVVLPKKYRKQVIDLGHNILFAEERRQLRGFSDDFTGQIYLRMSESIVEPARGVS